MQDLVSSESLYALLTPLPLPFLCKVVSNWSQNYKQAENNCQGLRAKDKKADNSIRSSLLGSMRQIQWSILWVNPRKWLFLLFISFTFETAFLLIFIFSLTITDLVNNSLQIIHIKVVQPYNLDKKSMDKVILLDLAKMISI